MNSEPQNNLHIIEEEGIDIKKYIFLILNHWWWFAITLFISLTIAYMINRYSQEVYSSGCSLIIGEPETRAGTVESMIDELSRIRGKKRKAVVENEISILKSYKMARIAISELDFGISYTAIGRRNIAESQLYKTSPFIVKPDTSGGKIPSGVYEIIILSKNDYLITIKDDIKKRMKFGEVFIDENNVFILNQNPHALSIYRPEASNKYRFRFNSINEQAKAYSTSLAVEVNAEKGSILNLRISGYVPTQLTDYLNKLSEVYIRNNLEEKNITSENTIEFIDRQLQGVVDSLQTTGIRLQEFRSTNKVINLSQEGRFLFEKMQNLQTEMATLDINSRYYNYLLEYINKRKDFSDVIAPSVIGIQDQLLNSLVAQLNQLNLQRRNLSLSVVENSPQVLIINNQISNTRNALEENLKSLIAGNGLSLHELSLQISKIEIDVQKLPGTERQLIDIEREFTINDQIYTFLLEKRAEAGISRASNISDHKTLDISRAENATIIKPKTSTNYLIALFAGIGLPLILLLIIDFFNTKINDRKYLETNIKAPIIGNIGHNEEGTELPVNENPRSSLAESFRALRTNLQYILKEPDAKVIAVSSAVSGEGKTFTSVNMASILAMADKKTLLVSLDLRRPKVHKVFNLKNSIGMSTYLISKNNFEDIISETNINNLFVATSGPIPPNPAELLSSDRMNDFIIEARQTFDYIILDTPPVAIVTDTLTLKNMLDAFIFVIRHNYSDKQVIDLVNNIYEKKLIKNTGIIVNDIQVKGYYGYSYRYGYGYGYGYSYSYRNSYYDETESKVSIFEKFKKR